MSAAARGVSWNSARSGAADCTKVLQTGTFVESAHAERTRSHEIHRPADLAAPLPSKQLTSAEPAAGSISSVVAGRLGQPLALVALGVVDLLALDRDRAVLVVLERGRAELACRPLVIARAALRAAVGQVLGLAVGPVLELLRRVAFLELVDLLFGLFDLARLVSGRALCFALSFPHTTRLPRPRLRKRPGAFATRPLQSESFRASSVSGPSGPESVRPPDEAQPRTRAFGGPSDMRPTVLNVTQETGASASGSRMALVSGARR
jgi:hypothetical protein